MSSSKGKLKAKIKAPKRDEVRVIAKKLGVDLSHRINIAEPVMKVRNKHKDQLIKEIQAAENNIVCYKSTDSCKETGCLWFSSCQ